MVAFTGFRAVVNNNPNVIANFLQRHINLIMFAQVPVLAIFSRLLDTRVALTSRNSKSLAQPAPAPATLAARALRPAI